MKNLRRLWFDRKGYNPSTTTKSSREYLRRGLFFCEIELDTIVFLL